MKLLFAAICINLCFAALAHASAYGSCSYSSDAYGNCLASDGSVIEQSSSSLTTPSPLTTTETAEQQRAEIKQRQVTPAKTTIWTFLVLGGAAGLLYLGLRYRLKK